MNQNVAAPFNASVSSFMTGNNNPPGGQGMPLHHYIIIGHNSGVMNM
jgi:hypothetical protein